MEYTSTELMRLLNIGIKHKMLDAEAIEEFKVAIQNLQADELMEQHKELIEKMCNVTIVKEPPGTIAGEFDAVITVHSNR